MKTIISKNRHSGMTLVEVMLGLVILAILGITATTSLFYPRHLTTSAATRRLAVDAATDHLERIFATDYLLISGRPSEELINTYSINGQTVTTTVYVEPVPALFDYLHIWVEATYPGGSTNEPVILETYRSPMK
jgi:prepilin-type N-terminal cleavage/methylation domain-containing protein